MFTLYIAEQISLSFTISKEIQAYHLFVLKSLLFDGYYIFTDWSVNFQTFKLDSEKAEEPEIKLPTSVESFKKQENFRKILTSALLTTLKPLTEWITINCGKFFKGWEYQTTLPASWEICMQVKKQQVKLDMKQQTGSKAGKEYVKAVYCHPAYLAYMQNTSCEIIGWMKHKLESRLLEETSITWDTQMPPPLWPKMRKN